MEGSWPVTEQLDAVDAANQCATHPPSTPVRRARRSVGPARHSCGGCPTRSGDDLAVREDAGERPLADLATRASDDPSIALLDAAAVVADVLTFYQERIANDGFLRTAIERRSVLEMARAIGYELNPGVAATAYLTFTVEDAEGALEDRMSQRGLR